MQKNRSATSASLNCRNMTEVKIKCFRTATFFYLSDHAKVYLLKQCSAADSQKWEGKGV